MPYRRNEYGTLFFWAFPAVLEGMPLQAYWVEPERRRCAALDARTLLVWQNIERAIAASKFSY